MADLLLTLLVGWYGFGLLAGLVLLCTQLAGRARRVSREHRAAGRASAAGPIGAEAAAPVAEARELRPQPPAGSRHEADAERRRAG